MGIFEKIFKKREQKALIKGFFKMLDGYTPVYTTYDGGVYEMELTRACIHTFANHASKLSPDVSGADLARIKSMLDNKPNPWMTSAQFLYKTATIYEAQNTCFIVPLLGSFDEIIGFYPVNPRMVEFVEVSGSPELWIKFTFGNGQNAAIEFSRCGVINKFLYKSDIRGENNSALDPTMKLLDMQNQGIREGIKNNSSFRFMAQLNNFVNTKDLTAERKRFSKESFSGDSGGMLLFPSNYTNVKQIDSQPRVVDTQQMKAIQDRVYTYFGCNEEILQNKAVGDQWSAYYEGKIEPFAIQLSQAMTSMAYSDLQISRNNSIMWSSNRLQYMTNAEKSAMIQTLFDRGLLSTNMGMDILNLPHVENGDKFYIRRDYVEIGNLPSGTVAAENNDKGEINGDPKQQNQIQE